MEHRYSSDGEKLKLKMENAVQYMKTDWKNVPLPVVEAMKVIKDAVHEL